MVHLPCSFPLSGTHSIMRALVLLQRRNFPSVYSTCRVGVRTLASFCITPSNSASAVPVGDTGLWVRYFSWREARHTVLKDSEKHPPWADLISVRTCAITLRDKEISWWWKRTNSLYGMITSCTSIFFKSLGFITEALICLTAKQQIWAVVMSFSFSLHISWIGFR